MFWLLLLIILIGVLVGALLWFGYKLLQRNVALHYIESVEEVGDRAITSETADGRAVARAMLTNLAKVAASSPNPLTKNREIAEHVLSKVDSVLFYGIQAGHMSEDEGRAWKDEVSNILYPLLRRKLAGKREQSR